MTEKNTEIRVLGELEIRRNGRVLPLPPSRKTRALLAYLVLTRRPHLRQNLCDLLWEGPYDPRGALRWSLSRIRRLVDESDITRLEANRERVLFERNGATVDLEEVQAALSQGAGDTPAETLGEAARAFRGELLEGLELPDCYQYNGWCIAEREAARKLRISILDALVTRLTDPEERLVFARERVAVNPLSEAAHVAVMEILGGLGRKRDALIQYDTCCRMLWEAFAVPPSEGLQRLRAEIEAGGAVASPAPAPPDAVSYPKSAPKLIGRQVELGVLVELASAAAEGRVAKNLLLSGEPGSGKSCLLRELGARMARSQGLVLAGRAYEAETARPFGPWFDAFGAVPPGRIPSTLHRDLAPLVPQLDQGGAMPADRNRLFNGVAQLLVHLGKERPVLVAMDDLQWFDDGSLSLLHYVIRALDGHGRMLVAATVRPEELVDNTAARSVLRTLGRENRLRELALGPLEEADAVALAETVAPDLDGSRVFAESRGNPLFVLEVASALARGGDTLPERVEHLIEDRLTRVSEGARAVLPWAAAVGRPFDAELIVQASGQHGGELAEALEELEGRAILTASDSGMYDFSHDLVRRTVYRQVSEPRRRLLHRQIAKALETLTETEPGMTGALVYHGERGGDFALAARACVMAGDRSLSLFAPREAMRLANLGLSHVAGLPEGVRIETTMGLLRIRTLAGSSAGLGHAPEHEQQLREAALEAERAGRKAEAATGHYLLSVVHEDQGQVDDARAATLRAAEAGRRADAATAARRLANTARCLMQLEQDIPRVRAMLDEAQTLCGSVEIEDVELFWGQGLLARWDGDASGAADSLLRALELARSEGDSWRECNCLAWLATVAFERGAGDEVRYYCGLLDVLAQRMGEGAKGTHALALMALAAQVNGSMERNSGVAKALEQLRIEDNKSLLAYTLAEAARLQLRAGHPRQARRFAEEALSVAEAIQRPSEIVCARAVLAESAHELGDLEAAAAYLEAAGPLVQDGDATSQRARKALAAVASRVARHSPGRRTKLKEN